MNLLDAANGLWAITAGMHAQILAIVDRHIRGEVADIGALEVAMGRPMKNPPQTSTIEGGVCLIPVNGVLCKAGNMFSDISGASSMQIIGQQFAAAMADPEVTAIILNVDSPGGSVDGTEALANQIFAARGQKPTAVVADGLMASAAYWIGSACDAVYVSGNTTNIGSVGVLASHTSTAGSDAARGLARTTITSGALKGVPFSHTPLDDTGRQVLQQSVDQAHGVFRDAVARHRKLSGAALDGVTDGRVLMGQSAISAALADGMASVDQIIQRFKTHKPLDRQKPHERAAFNVGDAVLASRRYQREQAAKGIRISDGAAFAHVQSRGLA